MLRARKLFSYVTMANPPQTIYSKLQHTSLEYMVNLALSPCLPRCLQFTQPPIHTTSWRDEHSQFPAFTAKHRLFLDVLHVQAKT